MMTLLESTGRSVVLLAALIALLYVLRIRNEGAQIAVLRTGLVVALLMPLLMQIQFSFVTMEVDALPALLAMATQVGPSYSWADVLQVVYVLIAAALVVRLAVGLLASWRLFRLAQPLRFNEIAPVSVRSSSHIDAPATVASTVLLPVDSDRWSRFKLRAVLAHEATHVRNRDFYWHVLALLHRAIFWFNPIAWWLPGKLAALAESRCDRAAVDSSGDAVEYAQVLLDFAAKPDPSRVTVGMAQSADIRKRVEQLLSMDATRNVVGNRARIFAFAATLSIAALSTFTSCQSPAGGQSKIERKVVVVQPRIDPAIGLAMPEYVPAERRADHEGTVFLAVLIGPDGRVAEARVKKSSGYEALDQSALKTALEQWRMVPGSKNGTATAMWVTVPVVFKLAKENAKPAV
jgi:TonB family protein